MPKLQMRRSHRQVNDCYGGYDGCDYINGYIAVTWVAAMHVALHMT